MLIHSSPGLRVHVHDDWEETKHPRAKGGQFSSVAQNAGYEPVEHPTHEVYVHPEGHKIVAPERPGGEWLHKSATGQFMTGRGIAKLQEHLRTVHSGGQAREVAEKAEREKKSEEQWKAVEAGNPKPSQEEAEAIAVYTGWNKYKGINNALRTEDPGLLRRWNKTIVGLKSYLDRTSTKEDMVIYRGLDRSYAKDFSARPHAAGQILSDPAFSSCSTNPDVAYGGVQLEIKVPKGSKAAAVPSTGTYRQDEVLLQAGARFKVTSWDPKTGKMKVELVSDNRVHDRWVESEHKRGKGGQFGSGAAHFKEGDPDPPELHGVPFKPYKPPTDWRNVEGQADIPEPPLDSKGKKVGAGLLMREPDGRVWIVKPTGGYGGYHYTFPKGTQEKGHSLQATAIKEAFEESGLKGRILAHAGDYEGDTSVTRYYHAVREGGTPTGHGWESEGVSLVPHHQLNTFLNRGRDRKIVSRHLTPSSHDAWEESKIHRGQPGNAGQFAKGEGTPHHEAVKKAVAAAEAEAPAPEHGILSATVNKHIHKAALEAGYEPVEGKPLEYEKKEPYGERIIARPGGYWTVHSASHGSPVTGKGGQSLAAFLKGEVGPESGYKVPQVKQAAAAKTAASRELDRQKARQETYDITNLKANRTDPKRPGGTLEPHDMHKVASIVADWMGYHDRKGNPRPITVKPSFVYFTLDGQKQAYAGGANLVTGEVSLYHEVLSADFTASCTAHEVMHQQFETVSLAYRAESNAYMLKKSELYPNEPSKKDYPIYAELGPYLEDVDKLSVDDGLTAYSKQWWGEWGKGKASSNNTVHETMAEMARLDWEGTLPRLLWYKNSTTWGPLYDAVRRLYPEVVKR